MKHRLVYFFIYTVRIKGFSFGMGPLFNVLGKGARAVGRLFEGRKKKKGSDGAKDEEKA